MYVYINNTCVCKYRDMVILNKSIFTSQSKFLLQRGRDTLISVVLKKSNFPISKCCEIDKKLYK